MINIKFKMNLQRKTIIIVLAMVALGFLTMIANAQEQNDLTKKQQEIVKQFQQTVNDMNMLVQGFRASSQTYQALELKLNELRKQYADIQREIDGQVKGQVKKDVPEPPE